MSDMSPRITEESLRRLKGLRRAARATLIARQPKTVMEALKIQDVGRKTTRYLLEQGLVTDPEKLQRRSMAEVEKEKIRASSRWP